MTSPEILSLQREEAKAGVLATSTSRNSLQNIRQLHGSKGERSSRSRSSHHRSSSHSGRQSSEKTRSSSRHWGSSSQRTRSLSSSRNGSSSERPGRSSCVNSSTERLSSHRSSRANSTDRAAIHTSSVGRRKSGNDNGRPRSNERRRRKTDPLSLPSHARPADSSSRSRDSSGSRRRHSKDKPHSRSNSLDSVLSIGTMDVLSEDDEVKVLSSGDDDILARKGKEHSKYANNPSGSKRKKSSRGSPSPSSFHSKNSSALSTLYGSDADAKAKEKAKASRGSIARAVTGSSHNSASKLLYGSDADAKAKAKAARLLGEDCWSSHSNDDNDDTFLSPAEIANAHIKARAAESRSQNDQKEQSNYPGFSSVSNTTALADKSNNAIGLLYGSNSDAKAKHQSARGSNRSAPVANTHDAVGLLYGSNADAKAKHRSARGRSTAAADPDPESPMLAAFLVEPVAMPVSVASTGSVSGNISDPQPSSRMISHAVSEAAGTEQPINPDAASSQPDHDDPNTRKKSRKKQKEEAPQKSTKTWIALFLLFLFLIGGGIAIWRFLFKNKGENQESSNFQDPSSAPSVASSDIGTWPTSPSFLEDLLYPPPSEDDCKAIARNITIAGREEMLQADYGLSLDVVLSGNIKMTQFLLDELLDAIQEKILPSLAGCHILVDEFVEAWRFVIFDAFVSGNVQRGESCMDDENLAAGNCHLVSVNVNLFLKGPVRVLDIIDLISDEEVNIRNHLGLSAVFSIVKLVQINSLTSSASPTIMPTPGLGSPTTMPGPEETPSQPPVDTSSQPPVDTPTKSPVDTPTKSPSLSPSNTSPSPVPTDVPSTPPSTMTPSSSPSFSPTIMPVVGPTPPPTVAPTPPPTLAPTLSPSNSPSVTPIASPSVLPSFRPSNIPSRIPTNIPSRTPTSVPSESPTATLSAAPTRAPSRAPSSKPSTSASNSPSKSPTTTPSEQPSVGVYYWVACGDRIASANCGGLPASLQRTTWVFRNGIPSAAPEDMLAVRCCSTTFLPGYTQRSNSCPWVDSDSVFDSNMCYNTATHDQAESICAGVGARLCTLQEVEDRCTINTGCGHNNKMIWTSTPGP